MAITMFSVGSPSPCTTDAQPRDQGRPATSSEEAFLARDFGSLGQTLASGDVAAAESTESALGAYLQQAAQARS